MKLLIDLSCISEALIIMMILLLYGLLQGSLGDNLKGKFYIMGRMEKKFSFILYVPLFYPLENLFHEVWICYVFRISTLNIIL
jgi:hypothetical protein